MSLFFCPLPLIFQTLARANLSSRMGDIIKTAEEALIHESSLSNWFFTAGLRTSAGEYHVTLICRPKGAGPTEHLFFSLDSLHPEMAIVSEVMSS